jgi:shikimate kinase
MTPDHLPFDRPLRGPGLALVGYRGSGKSTVGKILASRLGRRFLDADREIESRAGRSIAAIFAEEGEPSFRGWEERTLKDLVLGHPGAILATGGGVVLLPSNRRLLLSFGLVVWLQAEPAELARRLQSDSAAGLLRPSLTAAGLIGEIASVLDARRALYHELADAEIDTLDREPNQVAEQILALWTR